VHELDLFDALPRAPRDLASRLALLDSPDPLFDAFAREPPQRPSALCAPRGGRQPKSHPGPPPAPRDGLERPSKFPRDAPALAQCGFPGRILPRRPTRAAVLGLLIAVGALASACGRAAGAADAPVLGDAILVQLRDGAPPPAWSAPETYASLADARDGAGSGRAQSLVPLAALGPDDEAQLLRIPVPAGETPAAFAAELARDPAVRFAEPISLQQPLSSARAPDDPRFKDQWGLAEISAPQAWTQSVGDRSVIAAVVDDGVALDHPDLAANLWTNPGEVAGNGVDDDGDGIVDDVHGASFLGGQASGDPAPAASEASGGDAASRWHGTHVAGIIGAVGDNRTGVAGVNWRTSLMAVRALGPAGGRSDDLAQAIDYASAHGARVINASWGTGRQSAVLEQAIERAAARGALFVAAAGNDGAAAPVFPASLALPSMLSVAALDVNGALASFSNRGAMLAAPGVGILSTTSPGSYERCDGSSMAAAHVSGLAALLFAAHPGATAAQVRAAILSSAIAAGSVESGRIDAARALAALEGATSTGGARLSRASLQFEIAAGGAPRSQSVSLRSQSGAPLALNVSSSAPWLRAAHDRYQTPARVSVRVDASGLAPGDHAAVLSFVDDSGEGIDLHVSLHVSLQSGDESLPSVRGAGCAMQSDGVLHVARGALCTLFAPGLANGTSVPELRWTLPDGAQRPGARLTAAFPRRGEWELRVGESGMETALRVRVE